MVREERTGAAVTRRPGKPHPMQGQAGPFAGCPPRSRSAAEMDGCSRQNPAYRLATERAPTMGALSICPMTVPFSPADSIAQTGDLSGGLWDARGLALRARACEHVFAHDRLRPPAPLRTLRRRGRAGGAGAGACPPRPRAGAPAADVRGL